MGKNKKPKKAQSPDPALLEQIKEKYIQDLRTGQRYSIEKFDDQVLLISSGALVLSLNFIGEVVKLNQAVWLWSLYASWGALAVTMVLCVLAHLRSYNLHEKQIRRVENDEPLPDDKSTTRGNYFMAVALVLGIAFQIIFVTVNSFRMANEKTNPNEIRRLHQQQHEHQKRFARCKCSTTVKSWHLQYAGTISTKRH